MSMRYYAFSEIGFVADNNLITYIKGSNLDKFITEDMLRGPEDIPANHCIDEIDADEFREFMEDEGFSYDGDLEYSRLSPVNEKGINWPGCIEGEEEVYCYQLGQFPQLFKAAYNSLDEIVAEIKKEIGHLLPDNYDIAKHIYYVEGVYFG